MSMVPAAIRLCSLLKWWASRALPILIMAVHVYGYFEIRETCNSIGRSQSGLWDCCSKALEISGAAE